MCVGAAPCSVDFPDLDGRRGMSVEALVNVLGDEAAETLMYYWGGSRVSVPDIKDLKKVRLRERILLAFEKGATAAQVAERFGVSLRTVQRIRNIPMTLNERGK